jgi:signal transduction histidine kinase
MYGSGAHVSARLEGSHRAVFGGNHFGPNALNRCVHGKFQGIVNGIIPRTFIAVLSLSLCGMTADTTSAGFKPFSSDPEEALPLHLDMGLIKLKGRKFKDCLDHFVYCTQHLEFARNDWQRGQILHSTGLAYYHLAEYPKSLAYLLRAANYLPGRNDSLRASTFDWTSVVYLTLGDYERSMEYQLRAIRIRKHIGDSLGLASSFYTLGDLYSRQENFKVAITYFEQSLQLTKLYNDSSLQYSCLASLANFYEIVDSLDLCYEYSRRALTLARELDYPYGLAYALNTMGSYFLKMGMVDSARARFEEAQLLAYGLPDKSELCVALMGLGSVHKRLGDYSGARRFLQEALETTFRYDDRLNRVETYVRYSDLYRAQGDYKKALEYHELSSALQDSVMTEENKFNMANLRSGFETQQEVDRLEAEKDVVLLEKQQQVVKVYKIGIAGGLLLISIVGWLIYARYRARRKTYRLIEASNKVINAQNEQLTRYNEDLQLMAYAISHDLRDPLNHIGTLGMVIREASKKKRYADIQKCADIMANSADRMLNMLASLYRYTKLDDKSKALSYVDMNEIAKIAVENLNGTLSEHHAHVQLADLPERIPANREHMILLVQNLIGNGIKYNPKSDPEINMFYVRQNGHFTFCVSDNGPGIDPKYHDHIFGMFNRVDSASNVQGSGMGLALCKKIVTMHNGKMWVESEVGKGSRFYFTIPATQAQPVR